MLGHLTPELDPDPPRRAASRQHDRALEAAVTAVLPGPGGPEVGAVVVPAVDRHLAWLGALGGDRHRRQVGVGLGVDEGVAPHPHPPGGERLQVEDPAAQRTVGGPDPPVVLEHVDGEALGCRDHALGDREPVRVGGEVVLGQREVVVRAVGRDPGGDARLDRHRVVAHAARDQVEREGLHDRVERRATADRVAAQTGEQVDERLLAPPVAAVGLQQVEQHVAQGVDAGP